MRRVDGAKNNNLTFEVRRDRRKDARPGLVKMYAYHQPGPGGLPSGLASTEGLGRNVASVPVLVCNCHEHRYARLLRICTPDSPF